MRPHRPFRPLFRALACLSLLAPALASAPALARPPQSGAPPSQAEAATLDAARKIAEEGLTLYDSARYAEALDRFDRAAALVQAPTMGLMAARSLVKLGRLVEASARYASVTEMPLAPGASDAFKQALTDAAAERKSLTPRIPTLTLTLPPAPQPPSTAPPSKPPSPDTPSPSTLALTRSSSPRAPPPRPSASS
ncbi:MAG: hypothetical protein R3F14_27995 [Polyangiaceae bacterium]